MMKVFISMPMNGKTGEEIRGDREVAIMECEEVLLALRKLSDTDQMEIIDSIITEDRPEGANTSIWCLGKALELLATADIAFFAPGWEKARGCRIEQAVAAEYGIKMIYG